MEFGDLWEAILQWFDRLLAWIAKFFQGGFDQ